MNLLMIKKILAKNCTPLIISLNQPSQVLIKSYTREGISPDQYSFIDAVMHYSEGSLFRMPISGLSTTRQT
jgi:hypothetical protein